MKRILIVKIGAIGDVIMTLPMLCDIRRKYPEAHIEWVCGDLVHELLEQTRLINKIHTMDGAKLLKGNRLEQIRQVLSIWRRLAFRRYDLVLTCHADPRYQWITRSLYRKSHRALSHHSSYRIIPGRYHGQEYIRLFRGDCGSDGPYSIEFPELEETGSNDLKRVLEEAGSGYVVLGPGGSPQSEPGKGLRMWPVERYAALAQELVKQGRKVVIVGGDGDGWVESHFSFDGVISGIGRLSLVDLYSLLKGAAAMVSHDSGPMHMAVWAGAPLLALFGPTAPSSFLPQNGRIRYLWGGQKLSCRPCYNGKSYAKCSRPLCIQGITVAAVIDELNEWLPSKKPVQRGP